MTGKDILILLGGEWHDFEGFANAMKPLLEGQGYPIHVSYDLDILTHLHEKDVDLLLSYTCLAGQPDDEKSNTLMKFSDAQVRALVQWVQGGGALLAVHAATVLGDSDQALENLLGGLFLSHPPPSKFWVLPLSANHPITAGINAFEVDDELYIERYHPSVAIHMVAIHQQVAYPLVWSRVDGLGRVVHIALGHSNKTWEMEPFQRLLLQTIRWLLER